MITEFKQGIEEVILRDADKIASKGFRQALILGPDLFKLSTQNGSYSGASKAARELWRMDRGMLKILGTKADLCVRMQSKICGCDLTNIWPMLVMIDFFVEGSLARRLLTYYDNGGNYSCEKPSPISDVCYS